jgi:polyisoprenoid-binding protein YceI
MRVPLPIVLMLCVAHVVAQSQQTRGVYTVDPSASEVRLHVDKAGLFAFAGHTHQIAAPVAEGTVEMAVDLSGSSVRVAFDAAALRVTGEGEPRDDVPEVQRTMEGERVLDVSRFPRITFTSRKIDVTARNGDRLRLRVTGDLTLHGSTRSEQADVSVVLADSRLTAQGTLDIRQTDYGIEPVTAGAGTVRVKDAVRVTFTLVANAAP